MTNYLLLTSIGMVALGLLLAVIGLIATWSADHYSVWTVAGSAAFSRVAYATMAAASVVALIVLVGAAPR